MNEIERFMAQLKPGDVYEIEGTGKNKKPVKKRFIITKVSWFPSQAVPAILIHGAKVRWWDRGKWKKKEEILFFEPLMFAKKISDGAERQMIKCRFCDWQTPTHIIRKGKKKPKSSYSLLVEHVQRQHRDRFKEVQKCLDQLKDPEIY